MGQHVFPANGIRLKPLPAQVARVLGGVLLDVGAKPILGGEGLFAPLHVALERVQPRVDVRVLPEFRPDVVCSSKYYNLKGIAHLKPTLIHSLLTI